MKKVVAIFIILLTAHVSIYAQENKKVDLETKQTITTNIPGTENEISNTILPYLQDLMKNDYFKLIDIKPKEDNALKLIFKTATSRNFFNFTALLGESPLFSDVKTHYTRNDGKEVMSEITIFIDDKAKDNDFITKELDILNKKFSNTNFEKSKDF